MPDQVRPRRSVLYMPGANTRALEKARSLPADALIFDLEDAVDPRAGQRVVRERRRQVPFDRRRRDGGGVANADRPRHRRDARAPPGPGPGD